MLRMYAAVAWIWVLVNYNSASRLSVCCLFPCRGIQTSSNLGLTRSELNWSALQPRKRAWRARSFAFSGARLFHFTPNPKTRSLSSPPQRAWVYLVLATPPPLVSTLTECHYCCCCSYYYCYCCFSTAPARATTPTTTTAAAGYPFISISIHHLSPSVTPLHHFSPSSPWHPVSSDSRPLTPPLLPLRKDESSLSCPRRSIQMTTAEMNCSQAAWPRSLSIPLTSGA